MPVFTDVANIQNVTRFRAEKANNKGTRETFTRRKMTIKLKILSNIDGSRDQKAAMGY